MLICIHILKSKQKLLGKASRYLSVMQMQLMLWGIVLVA